MNELSLIKDGEINLSVLYRKFIQKLYLFILFVLFALILSNFYFYRHNLNAPIVGKIDVHLSSNSVDSVSNTLLLINELTFKGDNTALLNTFSSSHIYNNFFNDINLLSQQKKIIQEASEKFNKPFTKTKYKINVERFSSVNDVNSKIVITFVDKNKELVKYLLNKLIENSSYRVSNIFNEDVDRFLSIVKIDIEKRLEFRENQVSLFSQQRDIDLNYINKEILFTKSQLKNLEERKLKLDEKKLEIKNMDLNLADKEILFTKSQIEKLNERLMNNKELVTSENIDDRRFYNTLEIQFDTLLVSLNELEIKKEGILSKQDTEMYNNLDTEYNDLLTELDNLSIRKDQILSPTQNDTYENTYFNESKEIVLSQLNQLEINKENFEYLVAQIRSQQQNMQIMDYDEEYIIFEKKTISLLLVNIFTIFLCFVIYFIFIVTTNKIGSTKNA